MVVQAVWCEPVSGMGSLFPPKQGFFKITGPGFGPQGSRKSLIFSTYSAKFPANNNRELFS